RRSRRHDRVGSLDEHFAARAALLSRAVSITMSEQPEGEKGGGLLDLPLRLLGPILDILDDLGATVQLGAQSVLWAIRPPFRTGPLLGALDFIGAESTFIEVLVGLFTGMAFTVSTIVGFRQFSAEGMVGGVVALALARELAPV